MRSAWRSVRRSSTIVPGLSRSPASRQTIFALATPPGKAGVAVVRVAGPEAWAVWNAAVRRLGKRTTRWRPEDIDQGKMLRCEVLDARNGDVIDDGLAVLFKPPHSYTTQPTLELHIHSSPAILKRLLESLATIPGLRPAERGEFTRRAFEAGRMGLTQVEALRDLVESETEVQRQWARRGVEGKLKARYDELRIQLISALAAIEALIDFGEGEDIEAGVYDQARERVTKLRADIARHLSPERRGEIYVSGLSLAIFGPPNVGKSSLLNFLAQRDAAIVTPIPGTTRDVLQLSLDIAGWRVNVCDTAGLRHTSDDVEQIGVQRASQTVETADLSLCVLSLPELASHNFEVPPMVRQRLHPDTLVLLNKLDLVEEQERSRLLLSASASLGTYGLNSLWPVSVQQGAGMAEFITDLSGVLKQRYEFSEGDEPLITHARERAHLEATLTYLDAFLATGSQDVVLAAEELRYAAQEVGKISGAVAVEDVLDAVFREFCIGK